VTHRALLFSDLVDSTGVVERLGDAGATQLWAEHDRRARRLLARHQGREIDRTDGFFLLFDQIGEAARFAIAYQRAIAGLGVVARVGLHVGAVTLRHNAPEDVARGAKPVEVEGLAKPFAARIMSLARGGQVLLSGSAAAVLGDALPAGTEIASHGHYRLKGIDAPVEVFELGIAGSVLAPPQDTDRVYRVVHAGETWRPLREVRHNLVPERDAFIGRSAELRDLAHRLDAGSRLITVLGPGGTGKTRLVRRYARAWLGDWSGGVYFCDLSDTHTLDGIHFVVAQALGVPLHEGDPSVQLGHAIASRGRCLVILDNFEQVVAHAGATAGRWVDRAVEAAFVVTSRERLQLQGEEVVAIEPLPLDSDAVELFAVRARAHRSDFVLDAANRPLVAEVVRVLDGLPLAIELAAARVRVLSPAQIVERMKDRFRLLAGARGAAARQATLKAAIEWSWDLLAPWEQATLAQCSVFEGGFTLEAAEAVVALQRWPQAPPVMDAVQALVDKSLLRTWVPRGRSRYDIDEPYFGMYLSIREFAAEKCLAGGRAEQVAAEQRHGRHFAGFGSDDAIEALFLHGGIARRRVLALELDNLVAACRRAIQRNDGDCAVPAYRALWEVLNLKGPYALGADLASSLAAMDGLTDKMRVQAGPALAAVLQPLGRLDEARARLQQAWTLAQALGDRRREASVLVGLGGVCRLQGEPEQARQFMQSALQMLRELGNRRAEASLLGSLGLLGNEQGRVDEAQAYFDQAIALHREFGNRLDEANVLNLLGVLHAEQGRLQEAQGHFEQSLALCREVEDRVGEGEVLTNLGCLHQDLGLLQEAAGYFEQSLAIHREVGNRRFEAYVFGDLGRLHLQLGEWAEARACLEQALAITREIGDRRIEGSELRSLGELHIRLGQDELAAKTLDAAETVLRQVGDKYYLAFVLCGRAELAHRAGDLVAAQRSLREAEALAADTHSGPQSDLGRRLGAQRARLG